MFDKTQLRKFREDFDRTLVEFSKKHGITLSIGNISYSGSEFHTKLTGYATANGENPEQIEFEKCCPLYGLSKDDYGKKFSTFNGEYSLVGFKPKSRKYPVIGKSANGARYKFPLSVLDKIRNVPEGSGKDVVTYR